MSTIQHNHHNHHMPQQHHSPNSRAVHQGLIPTRGFASSSAQPQAQGPKLLAPSSGVSTHANFGVGIICLY
ncbi:hypothetical protein SMACR_08414 [Sordaria macrospora]|uniref:WGS project CABT00000000 data, contig 2.57 n=2 Tax=Sordaria macrospora TaxID=5147 RepID=F7WA35_SORMK|nr:uncharacterized protein SMAC_08414 [Sordaria macrospora k-hell]KAA8629329.1 hypothetical protein SMACR_08414 [Sordaria macrospora]KAH7625461.1 hypothetical protein B0T09DRAFT_274152 [Sordaria sp. MPI-SDFR-AT-0083]WPJ62567.1 hypothetical protein SMAC4_08414 [Sordaria macrospora]CCC14103.1 unnamed protein product [Sordaria macrospora k-hell]